VKSTVTLPVRDLAYAAALVDTLAVLNVREVGPSGLPMVTIHSKYQPALAWLGERTQSKITTVKRDYQRASCADHCPEAHIHIVSESGRWQVSGVKATIVLHNLLPFLRVQDETARTLIEAGKSIGYKGQVVQRMKELGWEIPELKKQPRSRPRPA
jgi:hypothetical protein